MKYKLINKPNDKFSTIEQILFNRGCILQMMLLIATLF